MGNYCIHCLRDLDKKREKVLDFSRLILCDDCTFRLVVTKGKEMWNYSPTESSQLASKQREQREARLIIRKLKPLEKRHKI